MIASPFPPWVSFALAPLEDVARDPIDPREAELVPARAVEKRHKELRAGRRLAHRALFEAGCATHAEPILWGPRHEPLWPAGWVGAISHAERWACAVVAPRDRTAGIGVDVESLERKVDRDIARIVCDDDERRWVEASEDERDGRLKAVFSGKESIFKALYPVAGVFLEFHDAHLEPSERGFRGTLKVAASPRHPAGFTMEIGIERFDAHVLSHLLLPP